MIRLRYLPILLLTSAILISCGGSDKGDNASNAVPDQEGNRNTARYDVTFDSELTATERTALNNSIDLIEKMKIDGTKIMGFSEVFGGDRSSSVVRYLEQRVNYLISQFTSHNSRLVLPSLARAQIFETFAINISSRLWFFDEYFSKEGGVGYRINNTIRDINSSRFGVVQLGNAFIKTDSAVQAITLVHEARHSDCPNGALLSDIINVVEDRAEQQDKTCGQLHSSCLRGSCDGFPWGPYAIDYIYSLAIYKTCTNCTEIQKQQALINANQVQKSAFDINGTLNGSYGPPDMGNSTFVRDDIE